MRILSIRLISGTVCKSVDYLHTSSETVRKSIDYPMHLFCLYIGDAIRFLLPYLNINYYIMALIITFEMLRNLSVC